MRTTPLSIYEPDDHGTAGEAPTQARSEPIPQPTPLMAVDIEQQTPQGNMIDRIILWRNEDASRCNWCSVKCTFQPGPEGQGTCIVRRQASLGLFG